MLIGIVLFSFHPYLLELIYKKFSFNYFLRTSSTLIEKDLECIKLSNDIATFKSDLSEKNAEIEGYSMMFKLCF